MQTLGYIYAVCKHIWFDVMAKGGKNNNGDNLRRLSMVVDGIKKSRTHTGSTCHVDNNFQSTHCYRWLLVYSSLYQYVLNELFKFVLNELYNALQFPWGLVHNNIQLYRQSP